MVRITIAGVEVHTVVHTIASTSFVEEWIVKKLGCLKRVRVIKVRQGDSTTLFKGKYKVNRHFKVLLGSTKSSMQTITGYNNSILSRSPTTDKPPCKVIQCRMDRFHSVSHGL